MQSANVAPIRLGLIGCGKISTAHTRGYKELGNTFQIVAVCDTDEQAALQRAHELGVSTVFTDYQALLSANIVEAVDLCIPHYLHAPIGIACLEAGVHVLVEKPIATTLADADKMIKAAQKAGKILMIGHNERYDHQYQKMKELVDEGWLGDIFCVRADHNHDFRVASQNWLRNKQEAGGGVLLGSGSHRIDMMRWLIGEIREVFCAQITLPDRLEGESSAVVTLRFESGAIGELACSWAASHAPWYELMWLQGTRGMVHNVPRGSLSYYSELLSEDEQYKKIDILNEYSFTRELRHFSECLRQGKTPLTDGSEGRKTLAVVLAAYQSVIDNRPVSVHSLLV